MSYNYPKLAAGEVPDFVKEACAKIKELRTHNVVVLSSLSLGSLADFCEALSSFGGCVRLFISVQTLAHPSNEEYIPVYRFLTRVPWDLPTIAKAIKFDPFRHTHNAIEHKQNPNDELFNLVTWDIFRATDVMLFTQNEYSHTLDVFNLGLLMNVGTESKILASAHTGTWFGCVPFPDLDLKKYKISVDKQENQCLPGYVIDTRIAEPVFKTDGNLLTDDDLIAIVDDSSLRSSIKNFKSFERKHNSEIAHRCSWFYDDNASKHLEDWRTYAQTFLYAEVDHKTNGDVTKALLNVNQD